MRASLVLFAILAATVVAGCKPRIGDACHTATDCAFNGSRFCDLSLSGGYCTIKNCDPDSCPDKGVCVEWQYDPPRTAQTYCMESCTSDRDCTDRGGYRCLKVGESPAARVRRRNPVVDGGYSSIARIIDLSPSNQSKGFCTYVVMPVFADGGVDGGP